MSSVEQELEDENRRRLTKLVHHTIAMLDNDELLSLVITGKRSDGSFFFMCAGVTNPYEMAGFLNTRSTDLILELEEAEAQDDDDDDEALLEEM